MEKDEIVEVFENFLDQNGMFHIFKKWISDQGYSLEEMGMTEED